MNIFSDSRNGTGKGEEVTDVVVVLAPQDAGKPLRLRALLER